MNLKECIRAAKAPGGLHQHRLSRPDGRRDPHLDGGGALLCARIFIKRKSWITAYENQKRGISGWNAGCAGGRRSDKGMWAAARRDGRDARGQDRASARGRQLTPGWPSPHRRRTLHSLHYHPGERGGGAGKSSRRAAGAPNVTRASGHSAGGLPALERGRRSRARSRNNAQGILGYVVRWIDVPAWGCSKVPDINDVALYGGSGDLPRILGAAYRKTWLHHGVVSESAGHGDHAPHGGRGETRQKRGRSGLCADGAGVQTGSPLPRPATWCFKGAGAAERVYASRCCMPGGWN